MRFQSSASSAAATSTILRIGLVAVKSTSEPKACCARLRLFARITSSPLIVNPSSVTPKSAILHPYIQRKRRCLRISRLYHNIERPEACLPGGIRLHQGMHGQVSRIIRKQYIKYIMNTWISSERTYEAHFKQFFHQAQALSLGERLCDIQAIGRVKDVATERRQDT